MRQDRFKNLVGHGSSFPSRLSHCHQSGRGGRHGRALVLSFKAWSFLFLPLSPGGLVVSYDLFFPLLQGILCCHAFSVFAPLVASPLPISLFSEDFAPAQIMGSVRVSPLVELVAVAVDPEGPVRHLREQGLTPVHVQNSTLGGSWPASIIVLNFCLQQRSRADGAMLLTPGGLENSRAEPAADPRRPVTPSPAQGSFHSPPLRSST